jgi:uncharacterized protein (TIGR02599 family)
MKAPLSKRRAFTIAELLVSSAIIVVLTGLLATLLNRTGSLWTEARARVDQFRQARTAFEAITTRISQATLNTYWDYDNAVAPTRYERRSELRFVSGPCDKVLQGVPNSGERPTHSVFFQALAGITGDVRYTGMENTLNTFGYFVEARDDNFIRPAFISSEIISNVYGYRLIEMRDATETNAVYNYTSPPKPPVGGTPPPPYRGKNWYTDLFKVTTGTTSGAPEYRPQVLADNIIALILIPRLSAEDEARIKGASVTVDPHSSPLAPKYEYDSSPPLNPPPPSQQNPALYTSNQLPPLMQVTLVAIDAASARKLNLSAKSKDPFGISGKFKETKDFGKDLYASECVKSLERTLLSKRVNYRIFTNTVSIKAARWSTE